MAESLIYDLCKAVANKLLEEGSRLTGVSEEALELGRKLKRIDAVLKAAEQREVEADVKEWIGELKDVAYDIEDVLDDWSIAQLQIQDEAGTSQRGNKSKSAEGRFSCIPTPPCFFFKKAKSHHDIALTIIKINKRLDEIDERKKKFSFSTPSTGTREGPKREPATSYGDCAIVDSQKNCKAEVIKKLMGSDFKVIAADRIPIISIVGMGGMGKTTVARLVYDDQEVKTHFSQKIAWVCVSNTFNAMNVAKAIAHNLCRISSANESELQCVLTEIENFIRGKKFLLILDDVWEDSEGKWAPILNCLSKGDAQGSRILMTTRDSNFSRTMGPDIVPVDKLSETDAMSLFSFYAFCGDPDHREMVEDIAVQLVEKCDGLPLALQVLGSHMATKTTRSEWNDVLLSKMWETQFQQKVFNSLAFSYLELPSQAKRCLSFCSVFPKDKVMRKRKLIRLWMAQGYLQGADQTEVLGEECFESLLRRSFFRLSGSYSDEYMDVAVTMHDIVHDFAQYISNDEVAILDPSLEMKGTSDNLRHLAFSREIINESDCPLLSLNLRAYKLRTLFIHTHKPTAVLDKLWSKISYIRALHIKIPFKSETLDDYDLKDIGKLIHLRYVSLGFEKITVLPEEICRLPCLQTLDLTGCYVLEKLPKDIGRLTTLRHLLFCKEKMNSLPKGLGKLSSLRTLSYFMCGGLANEDCISLGDLSLLNNLQGDLRLRNLNSVANIDEATRAALYMKTQICRLTLGFGDGDASLQSEVLEALQPAKENIEFLKIKNYKGKACPPWIGQMRCLKEVRLYEVSVESLPELGTLRFLENLYVKGADAVRHVGAEIFGIVKQGQALFPKLKSLRFKNMSNWEQWNGPEEIMRSIVTVMPSLHSLQIRNCKALQTLPRFLLEHVPLESFEVDSDRLPPVELVEDDYPNRWRIGDILLPQTLKTIVSPCIKLRKEEAPIQPEASQVVQQQHLNLIYVEIDAAYPLSTFISMRIMDNFAYLRKITLSGLEDVRLPPLGALAYLEELTISNGEKVEKVGDEFLGISSSNNNNVGDHRGGLESTTSLIAFPRLKMLSFHSMQAWREWEDLVHGNNLTIMPSLRDLKITECTSLKSLPHFFEAEVSSLENLYVGATAEGDMPKIRSAGKDEAANYKMSKARTTTTTPLAQPELRVISLEGVRNEWLLDWAKYCVGLRELRLVRCGEASFVGQLEVSLPSLETIIVYRSNVRKMGMGMLRISSLKVLHFDRMYEWEEWEEDAPPPHQPEIITDESRELSQHDNNNNFTSNLRVLSIYRCPKLMALPSFVRSLRTLEILYITECDALRTWWETEASEDWRKWISTIPTVHFQPFY